MNNNNNKEIDLKIKEALKDNDSLVVPEKISKGIDETLQGLENKKINKTKKVSIIASAGVVLLTLLGTSLGVEAIKAVKDAIYTYIPSLGTTINTDELIYTLKEPITNSIGKRKTTLAEVYYNTESELIIVDVEGNGKLPEDKAILKINNKKIKSNESSLHSVQNTGRNISWTGSYFFKYKKPYNNEDIEFRLVLENKETAIITCKLMEAKNVTNKTDLGPSDTNKDITITGVVEEKEDKLEISLLDNLEEKNIGVSYEEIILTDAKNEVVLGNQVMNSQLGSGNKFIFDISKLKKPFKITIPQVVTYMHDEVSSSDIIQLPIPAENEEVIIDKKISLETKDKLIEGSNTDINIVSIKREYNDECTVKLDYSNYEKRDAELVGCVVVPAGNSVSDKAKDWFEDGLSGGLEGDYIKTLTFKLPYPDADKLYIKVRGNEYKITGPWEIIVD